MEMAALLYLCFLAAMVAKPVVPMTTTQSPYVVVEDNGDTLEDTEDTMEDTSTAEDKKLDNCTVIMANNGLNFSSFYVGAAHGIHSLYLEDIREYFEPDATVDNKIPTVNSNLSTEQTILFNAPLAGYDEDFQTMALKVMSYYMLHDKPDFVVHGLNTLEKLGHQYHMHEVWKAAAPIYQMMKENPSTDMELCPCVNDITGNGILTRIVKIAKDLKHFGSKRQPRARRGCWKFSYKFSYGSCDIGVDITIRGKRSAVEELTAKAISQYEAEYLADPSLENSERMMKSRPWQPNSLVGPEQWVSYEAMLRSSMITDEEINDFATFMYCKLNQPELDQPMD